MGPHLTPHTPHSDQISSPVQPQVSHGKDSDVSFHTAAYSQCSNTETAQAGASEEDPQTRNPWAFYTLTVSQKSPLPPEPLAPAPLLSVSIHLTGSWPLSPLLSHCFPVSIHLAGVTHLHTLCYPKGWQFMASLLRLLPRALHFNLHLSLQLVSPATWARCIPQHSAVMGN